MTEVVRVAAREAESSCFSSEPRLEAWRRTPPLPSGPPPPGWPSAGARFGVGTWHAAQLCSRITTDESAIGSPLGCESGTARTPRRSARSGSTATPTSVSSLVAASLPAAPGSSVCGAARAVPSPSIIPTTLCWRRPCA